MSEGDRNDDVGQAAGGDTAAFERLYRHHAPRVHTLACRMVGREAADDATQDVFLRAWQKLGTFRRESSFATWLGRLARNVLLNRQAVRTPERQAPEQGVEVADSSAAPTAARLDLETALGRLPRGAREVFVLRQFEQCSHEEIARLLGISVGTSKSQLHRARMLLCASLQLEERGR